MDLRKILEFPQTDFALWTAHGSMNEKATLHYSVHEASYLFRGAELCLTVANLDDDYWEAAISATTSMKTTLKYAKWSSEYEHFGDLLFKNSYTEDKLLIG